MKSLFSVYHKSAKELISIKCITVTGIFIAISMIIEMYSIDLQFAKINFAFIAIAVIGMLFGPTVSLLAGFACDMVGFLVHPTGGFLFVYVFVACLQGMIYGLFLYHKAYSKSTMYIRAALARLTDIILINLLINTKLNLYYGFIPSEAYSVAVASRIFKNLIELCVDLPLMFILLPIALKAYQRASATSKTNS